MSALINSIRSFLKGRFLFPSVFAFCGFFSGGPLIFEHACIGCMNLHVYNTLKNHMQPQSWRGLRAIMQLHEKRHKKRAGEAGRVLRAGFF
ncbi:hypothetical protein [Serratia liquefaciens]|uniref:hypothetical protein n=1 Tax=Serratia liquefaciens TaxID=614 RepID=UPI0021C668BD|nr:hypothetical protein [Serratia liquefaciens]HDS5482451.1 hypothetical protein [Serratia liquefaciens]HDU8662846.1 hypothetical protein [Serratia liquefaciens]